MSTVSVDGSGAGSIAGRLAGPAAAGGTACAGFVIAPLTPVPDYVSAGSLGVAGLSLLSGIAAYRSARRLALVESLQLGLAGLIGAPARTRIRPRQWRGGFIGIPHQLTVWFDTQARTHDPKWVPQILEICRARTGLTYAVKTLDHRKSRVQLASVASATPIASTPEQRRAERTVGELLGPTATVTRMDVVDGRLSRICASHQNGTRLANSGYRSRVERTLSAVLPGRWRAKWDLQADTVIFEHRPSFPKIIWLEPSRLDCANDVLSTYDEVAIAYGADEDGNPAIWRPAIDPNLMVVGSPGTGKTVLEHAVLVQVSRYNWPIWVLDGKSVEFLGFRRDWPNVQVVATTIEHQVAVIERAWQVMEHRYQLITQGLAREEDFEPLMVFVDEFADFRANLADWYVGIKQKGDPAKPPCLSKVASIARKGRTSRVHLLFATQRPDAEFIGGEALDLETPIATPAGWSRMGDLRVGDHVFAEDGRPVAVSAVTDVLQDRPCYRVVFSDGASIVADADHLWSANPECSRGNVPRQEQIVTTADLADTLLTERGEPNWSVPATAPLEFPESELSIDPWLLGYWFGARDECGAASPVDDHEALDRARSLGSWAPQPAQPTSGISTDSLGGDAPLGPSLKSLLRGAGLLHNKQIPCGHLRGSIRQREELLAGLLDSAGACGVPDNEQAWLGPVSVSFVNSDRQLVDQVIELVTSLGFVPTVSRVHESGQSVAASGTSVATSVGSDTPLHAAWAVEFTPDRQVFGIPGKQKALELALTSSRNQRARQRYVVAVERVEPVPVRCITVDSSRHLYLAGRELVPTHNCRDNFRARISMGRLSPQGAMMMWQDPTSGTTVPRNCRGRATTINDDNEPVEIQTFFIPDPRKATSPEATERLARVRPAEATHERLVILAPEFDVESGHSELTYQHYAAAQWVCASARPDLDPANFSITSAENAREMASPLTILGVNGRQPAFAPVGVGHNMTGPVPGVDAVDEPDPFSGFGPVTDASPDEVMIGDLVLHPDLEEWVTVDAPVEEDVTEQLNRSIFWRDDSDESGHLSVPADEPLSVRRPIDEGDEE